MAFKASSNRNTDGLILALSSTDPLARDAAVARLRIIGTPAIRKLVALAQGNAPGGARAAALRACEGSADSRVLDAALACMSDPHSEVATAAIAVTRTFLPGRDGARALDGLTALALDGARANEVRIAAVQALADLPAPAIAPLLAQLQSDPVVGRTARPQSVRRGAAPSPLHLLRQAAEDTLPDDPVDLRQAIGKSARQAQPQLLRQLVERIRIQEGTVPAGRRHDWMAARAAVHAALAEQHSRVALYDLRETIESARQPVAVEFLSAITALGDASCLESIASAYARAAERMPREDWWLHHLAEAFRAIAGREGVTRRHAVVKKIERRWPGVVEALIR